MMMGAGGERAILGMVNREAIDDEAPTETPWGKFIKHVAATPGCELHLTEAKLSLDESPLPDRARQGGPFMLAATRLVDVS